MSKEVMNAQEAAEFLGFAPYTIREKARDGEIPGKKVGREWRFSRRMLLKFIEAGSMVSRKPLSEKDISIAQEMIAEYEQYEGDSTRAERERSEG